MRRLAVSWIVVFLLCSVFPVLGENKVAPFVMPSARFSALGGRHSAMADDFYSIFLNPAAFVDVDATYSVAEITLSTYGPVLELIDLLRENSDSDLDISELVGPGGFAAGFDLGGPISVGWVGRGLGLGFFNRMTVSMASSGANIKSLASGEVFFVAGYGFRILDKQAHILDGGFLGKGFFRGALDLKAPIIEADALLDDIADQPFVTHLGMGLDLGLRYTYRENLTAAMVCYDIYSPVLVTPYDSFSDFKNKSGPSAGGSSYGTVKRRLDVGMKYRIRSGFIDRYFTRLTVMADYRDFLDLFSLISRHPILNLGIGAELTVLNALSFRVGMTDALPAFGFGLDLTFATLDFAIYGRELGLDPGVQSVYAMDVGLLFRY